MAKSSHNEEHCTALVNILNYRFTATSKVRHNVATRLYFDKNRAAKFQISYNSDLSIAELLQST